MAVIIISKDGVRVEPIQGPPSGLGKLGEAIGSAMHKRGEKSEKGISAVLIVAIVLGVVFLVVLLLSIPIDLAFSYERGEGSRSRMRIGWLFGLIGKELGGEKKGREKKPKERKAKKGRRSFRGPLALNMARGFSGRLFLLARRLARSVQVRDVDVKFQVGTGDPAEMGPALWVDRGPA